ncbi:MAG TPA: hypothetical protein PLB89_05235 [Flavobacteriales bacterium]|nr:hypothetical protein [Flavobacteriales bacterium]
MSNEKRGRTIWDFLTEADGDTIFWIAIVIIAVVGSICAAITKVLG